MAHWDNRFLELAEFVSAWSKDPSTKVGCILVDVEKTVLGLGYNGFPRGVEDSEERLEDRKVKYLMVQHAEANAINNAQGDLRGATAYVTHKPCANCCGALIQAGIREIVIRPTSTYSELAERLEVSYEVTDQMLSEADILCREVYKESEVAAE